MEYSLTNIRDTIKKLALTQSNPIKLSITKIVLGSVHKSCQRGWQERGGGVWQMMIYIYYLERISDCLLPTYIDINIYNIKICSISTSSLGQNGWTTNLFCN